MLSSLPHAAGASSKEKALPCVCISLAHADAMSVPAVSAPTHARLSLSLFSASLTGYIATEGRGGRLASKLDMSWLGSLGSPRTCQLQHLNPAEPSRLRH